MSESIVRKALVCLVGMVALASMAQAQATRTWVSGVGDDANPCSRTAPCKTFAGAISKTATGGEINVLDPGGFGGVTITKAITISSESFEAGVLVSGTNAIVINVPNATDRVVLRGLDIEGLGTGLSGITVLQGGTVHVENCTINRFTVSGINFATTVANSSLHVTNTIIRGNGNFGVNTGQGIFHNPSAFSRAVLNNVTLANNVAGLKVQGGSNTFVTNSVASANSLQGFAATTVPAVLNVTGSTAVANGTGASCIAGTILRLGDNTIVNNVASVTHAGGCASSFGQNFIDVPGLGLTPITPQ